MAGTRLFAGLRRHFLPLLLFVFTTAYLIDALRQDAIFEYGVPSTTFFPIALAIIMYVAILAAVVQGVREARAERLEPVPAPDARLAWDVWKKPAAATLLTIAYIAVLMPLGYKISTVIYVYGLIALFGYGDLKRPTGHLKNLVAAVGITAMFYVLFVMGFGVRLPVAFFWGN